MLVRIIKNINLAHNLERGYCDVDKTRILKWITFHEKRDLSGFRISNDDKVVPRPAVKAAKCDYCHMLYGYVFQLCYSRGEHKNNALCGSTFKRRKKNQTDEHRRRKRISKTTVMFSSFKVNGDATRKIWCHVFE